MRTPPYCQIPPTFPLASFPLPRTAGLFHGLSASAVSSQLKLGLVRPVGGCLTSEKTSKSCIRRDATDLNQPAQPKTTLRVTFQIKTGVELPNAIEMEQRYYILSCKSLFQFSASSHRILNMSFPAGKWSS